MNSSKTSELVQHRATIELLTGKLTRGHQAVLDAEQVVILDAETAAQPIDACKPSAISAYFQNFEGGQTGVRVKRGQSTILD
jgi:hypothetical protein